MITIIAQKLPLCPGPCKTRPQQGSQSICYGLHQNYIETHTTGK